MELVEPLLQADIAPWAWLSAAWLVYLVPMVVWVILQRREPVATLSWVLSLALLPYIGFLIYYLLGPQRVRRRVLRRSRSRAVLDQGPETRALGEDQDSQQASRLASLAGGYPRSSCTGVELLVDGVATFDAILAAVDAAEHHIHVEYYIFTPDRIGTRLRDALIRKAHEGLRVRVLIDAVGGARLRRSFLAPLRLAGAEIAWFHPTRWVRMLVRRPKLNMRSHRKIVVVDGHLAFTGGINIDDCHDERLDQGRFHDLHVRVTGEAVRWLQLTFLEDWHYATGVALRDDRLWPELTPGPIQAQVLASGPDTPWEPIHRLQVELIYAAQQRVWLVTPYFVPGEAALFALTSAAMRGLDVRVLLPTPRLNDSVLVAAVARSYYPQLLEAGVTVWHYRDRTSHAKALVIDEDEVIVGTANFDHRSFRLNFEVAIWFHDPGVTATLAHQLELDFAGSDRVEAQTHPEPFGRRLLDSCARLLNPIL